MELRIIAAVSKNNVIGIEGKLPWRIKEDMYRFKELTIGHPVIMGRKTYESIPEKFRPLPGRANLVLTKNRELIYLGTQLCSSMEEALDIISVAGRTKDTEIDYNIIYVIGGESVYREALPLTDRLELTHVNREVEGDAFFPEIDEIRWREIKRQNFEGFSFVSYGWR